MSGQTEQVTTTYSAGERILIALTQLLCQVWFGWIKKETTWADESTSAFVWRTGKVRWILWVNWLFADLNHCETAYKREKDGSQNAPEYRAKFDKESA